LVPRIKRQGNEVAISPALNPGIMRRELTVKDWSGADIGKFAVVGEAIDLSASLGGRSLEGLELWVNDTYADDGLILESGPW
jgi:hypothetical protein